MDIHNDSIIAVSMNPCYHNDRYSPWYKQLPLQGKILGRKSKKGVINQQLEQFLRSRSICNKIIHCMGNNKVFHKTQIPALVVYLHVSINSLPRRKLCCGVKSTLLMGQQWFR